MPKESTKLLNPVVRVTRNLRKRLESNDSDSGRSNTPVIFDLESNKSETSPTHPSPDPEKNIMKRSIETPTKITRRTKIETKSSDDAALSSPARKRTTRATSLSLDDKTGKTAVQSERKSPSIHQQTPIPTRKILTRRSSLLLNESVDVSPISSPSKRGRRRSINLTEDVDDKIASGAIVSRKITLLDTCVPEEDTNDLPSELDEESLRSKSPKNLNQDEIEEMKDATKLCPAYCTRSRSKSPNIEGNVSLEQNVDEENTIISQKKEEIQEEGEKEKENVNQNCNEKAESVSVEKKIEEETEGQEPKQGQNKIEKLVESEEKGKDIAVGSSKNILQAEEEKKESKQETNENKTTVGFDGKNSPKNSESNSTVLQFDDESNQRKLRSQKSDSKLKYQEDDHSNKLSVSNQSADELDMKTYNKICGRMIDIIDLDSDDEKNEKDPMEKSTISVTLANVHADENNARSVKHSQEMNESKDKFNVSTISSQVHNSLHEDSKSNMNMEVDEEFSKSSIIPNKSLTNTGGNKTNEMSLSSANKSNQLLPIDEQDNEKTNVSGISDASNCMQNTETTLNLNADVMNDKKDKENIAVNNTMPELTAVKSRFDGIGNSMTPFKKRMSCELRASSTPIAVVKSIENDPSKVELSTIENNEKDLTKNSSKKHQSVVIAHSDTIEKSSKLFPKTPVPSKSRLNSSEAYLFPEENDSILNETHDNNTKARALNLSERSSKSESSFNKSNQIDFAKSWSHAIKGNANTTIDAYGLKKNDEAQDKVDETELKTATIATKSDDGDDEASGNDDAAEEQEEEEKGEEGGKRCEFIISEAEEIIDYRSGESLDSEEREFLKENELPEYGESIGSQDTNDEQHADDEEEPDDEMRAFIVTDEEEAKFSDDDEDDGDTDDSDSDTDDSGGDDDDESESPIDNKKRKLRNVIVSSSEEDDNEPSENNENVVINNKSNKETNEEIEQDKNSAEKEGEQQDLNNSSGTVVANVPVTAAYETITFSKFVSKENVEICEKQKEMNLLSKSTSVIEDSTKGENSSQKQTRHSLPAESKTFMNSPNRGMKSPEKEITETIVEEETVKGLNENPGSEQLNESFSSERRTSDDKSLETANSSDKVVNEDFEELQISLSNENQAKLNKSTMSTNSVTESKHEQSSGVGTTESGSNQKANYDGDVQDSSTDSEKDPYERILERCSQILEAACEAKRQAKLLNKKKPKRLNKKEIEQCEDDTGESHDQSAGQKQKKLKIEKALKFSANLLLKQTKTTESARVLKTPSIALKAESSVEKRLPEDILSAIEKSPQSDKENATNKELSKTQDHKTIKDSKESKVIKRKFSGSDSEQVLNAKKKTKLSGIIRNPSGIFFEELLTPKKTNKSKLLEFAWGTVREERIKPEAKAQTGGFRETPLKPKSLQFKIKENKSSGKHRNDTAANVQEFSWGTVREEPLYGNPNDETVIPRPLGHKVKKALTSGQVEPPILSKNEKKNKKRRIMDAVTFLPKPVWMKKQDSQSEDKETWSVEGIPIRSTTSTDFFVKPLTGKKRKRQIDPIAETALEFKKRAVLNAKVPREASRQLLQRKEKQRLYNKF